MDLERPHFRTTSTGSSSTTTGELFICFTSRLSASSSSMKLTKSILSPGRAARDGGGGGGPVSLSSSLSRRLRTNGSLKGGASPFFTSSTTGKKRGCAFENPEPSSPKVTCIGQVRVKTKKKVKQSRSLSKRRSGEVMSFRKIEHANSGDRDHHQSQEQRYSNASGGAHYQHQHQQQQPPECLPLRNQRWVHLPISICEALSCLFPCKSSCFSTAGGEETEKAAAAHDEKQNGTAASGDESGCGAVFARWMVSVNDGEGGKRREIELVVGGGDEEGEEERVSMRSSRRHVFEDFEVKDDRIEVKGQINEEKEVEEGRVSICIPPKNALLLMRCRSDPMKMADLATRFSWDAKTSTHNHNQDIKEEEEEENNEVVVVSEEEEEECEGNKNEVFEQESNQQEEEEEEEEVSDEAKMEMEQVAAAADIVNGDEELVIISSSSIDEKMVDEEEEKEIEELQQEILGNLQMFSQEEEKEEEEEEEVESNMSSFEDLLDQENPDHYQETNCPIDQHEEEEMQDNSNLCHLSPSTESDEEINVVQSNEEAEESNIVSDKVSILEINNDANGHQILKLEPAAQITTQNGVQEEEEDQVTVILPNESEMVENRENEEPVSKIEEEEEEPKKKVLPECLLLMMCEPKLSMEVSKETWVCSTDFVRWLPERPRKPAKSAKPGGGCDHAPPPPKRRLSIDSKLKPVAAHAPSVVPEDGYRYQHYQPPRSSCSLPAAAAAASMANMIEQKLVNAVGYEPFVLTRCKSEPMRSAAAKLIPESCFWKNAVTKLEPHGRAALGVGAAGVGF